ncbi:hypothetical protein NKH98_10840 [Mesorhizobium sp. M0833]|uniref:hypothetical protein n=1 Tax=Mesorhizobium sp. M0833 TaxID=2957009 RepID=UPI003335468F
MALSAMIVALAGCQTGQDPATTTGPEAAFDRCVSKMAITNVSAKQEIAAFMGVSMERMPALFCRRLVNAAVSGRITFSDINSLQLNQSTDIWKVIKGR